MTRGSQRSRSTEEQTATEQSIISPATQTHLHARREHGLEEVTTQGQHQTMGVHLLVANLEDHVRECGVVELIKVHAGARGVWVNNEKQVSETVEEQTIHRNE